MAIAIDPTIHGTPLSVDDFLAQFGCLVNEKYEIQQFRADQAIASPTFPALNLAATQGTTGGSVIQPQRCDRNHFFIFCDYNFTRLTRQ